MSVTYKKLVCSHMASLKCFQTNNGLDFVDGVSAVMNLCAMDSEASASAKLSKYINKHYPSKEFHSISDTYAKFEHIIIYTNEHGRSMKGFTLDGLQFLCSNIGGAGAFRNGPIFSELIEGFRASQGNKHPSSSTDEGPVPKRRAITGSIPYHVAKVMQKQLVDKVATSVSDSMKPVQSQITAVGQDVTSMGQDIKHIQATASNTQGQLHMMGEGMASLGNTLISGQSKLLHAGSHVLGGIEKLGQSTVTIEKQVKEELKTVREKNGKQEYAVSCLNKTIREKDSLLQKKDGQLQKKDEKLYEYQEVIKTFHRDFGTVDSKLVKLGAAVKELQASHADLKASNAEIKADLNEMKASIQSLVNLLSA